MSIANVCKALAASAAALAVAACGGSGGTGVASIPSPPVIAPTPPPTVAQGALAVPPSGVSTSTDFATVGGNFQVRWNAALQSYEVTVPNFGSGKIVQTFFGPAGASGDVVAANGDKILKAQASTPYSYTGRITLSNLPQPANTGFESIAAYGVLTPAGSVPTTGSASYAAELDGRAGSGTYFLYGTASLQFDFGAGKLSGFMDPVLNNPYAAPELPRYNFTQTVYSTGSTSFSGSFDVTGPTPSSFSGRFTGPNAQELMASFRAPFIDFPTSPDPAAVNWGVLEGVMIGKRP